MLGWPVALSKTCVSESALSPAMFESAVSESLLPPDLADWQLLHAAPALQDGGAGLRFEVMFNRSNPCDRADPAATQHQSIKLPAFAVKHNDHIHAYLNQCAHVAMEMDWLPGQFFDASGEHLICASHGAVYDVATGLCLAGPCTGQSLKPIPLIFHKQHVYASQRI